MADGYLTDTPYTWGFYAELNPVFLNYVCALNGHAPRPLDRPFTYCDLGCGNGLTVTGLAQLFPHAEFTAIDFNTEHVTNGAALAAEARLDNVTFMDTDFADLAGTDLPAFDFVVLHGVYSWVDPGRRNAIREFLAATVKPGGVVYVSYDCLPGWAAIAPLRDLMLQRTAGLTTETTVKAQAGLDFLKFLRDHDAGYFTDNPPARAFLDEIAAQDIRYVAHEFFGESVKPYYFHQVAAEMRSAGLIYSGSALVHLNFVDLAAPAEFRATLAKSESRIAFETNGDFIRNQRFRKDVYVRGQPTLDEDGQAAALAAMPFGTVCDADNFRRSAQFGDVALNYVAEVFELVIRHASQGAKTVADLMDIDGFSRYGPDLVTDAIRFLTAGGQLVPFGGRTDAPDRTALTAERFAFPVPFNLAALKARLLEQPALGFVSPAAGIGMEVAMADALFALCSAEAPRDGVAEWAFQRLLEARKQIVFEDGSELDAIAQALETFRAHRLAKFLELGILVPGE